MFNLPKNYRIEKSRSGFLPWLSAIPQSKATGRRTFIAATEHITFTVSDLFHTVPSQEIYNGTDYLKIHFRLEGISRVIVGDSAFSVTPLSVSILGQSSEDHKVEQFKKDVHERSITLTCPRQFIEELTSEVSTTPGNGSSISSWLTTSRFSLWQGRLGIQSINTLRSLFIDNINTSIDALRMQRMGFSLFDEFLKSQLEGMSSSRDVRISGILEYIDQHLGDDLSIEHLSRKFHFSESSLIRLFRDNFGCPPHQYVVKRRMKMAKELIRSGKFKMNDVARMVGFKHLSNFSTAYSKYHGNSPRASLETDP